MIDYFSGVDTEFFAGLGEHYGGLPRRLAVLLFLRKGPSNHQYFNTTRDRSEFYVSFVRYIYLNF